MTDDLLPTGLQQPNLGLDVLPSSLQDEVRQAVLRGLGQLVDGLVHAARGELVEVLAQLLLLRALRPTAARVKFDAQLVPHCSRSFWACWVFHRATDSAATAVGLLADVLARCTASLQRTQTRKTTCSLGSSASWSGCVGSKCLRTPPCSRPNRTPRLCRWRAFCRCALCTTPRARQNIDCPSTRSTAPCSIWRRFLEHFVHHAASRVRLATPAAGMAKFNVCQAAYLVSLGAKVRMMQLENEVRLARLSPRTGAQRLGLQHSKGEAELVVMPGSLSLKIERRAAWMQSRELLTQVLEGEVDQAAVRALRVEFAGEHAADGGGPAREWFATVTAAGTTATRSRTTDGSSSPQRRRRQRR